MTDVSDVSLYDHKFDLVYCQWNTRKPGVFQNISFLMLYYDNYISHYVFLAVNINFNHEVQLIKHSHIAATVSSCGPADLV